MKLKKLFKITQQLIFVFLFMVVMGFFGVFACVGVSGATYLVHLNSTLPTYEELANRDVPESSKVYSRDGTLLYEFHGEYKRTRVDLERIPDHLKQATLAIEDKDFYKHGAISVQGIARALVTNYKEGGIAQGGSTITQQFVKNALLTRDKAWRRKIQEVLLAYKVEAHFTKDEILELYLNEIPYGRNAYGAEAASQAYFDKSVGELTLHESAYLAALPQRPSYYSPFGDNKDALESRKNLVLNAMREQGYITELEEHQANNSPVAFRERRTNIIAPYFVSSVQNYLTEKYGKEFLQEGGLRVYTTIDLKMQELAERVVKEGAESNAQKYRAYNAALVAVEPATGKILAIAGGKDYWGNPEPKGCRPGINCKFEPNVNVATSERQPGSSIKPIVYATAFKPEFGFTPLSKVLDVPAVFGYSGGRPYIPQNYDGSSRGPVTMRKALAGSLNIPAVRTLAAVGVNNAVDTMKNLGYSTSLKNCGLSLVLGGCEVKLIDHVSAFAVLANGGKGSGGTPFLRIEDKHGKVLEEYQEPTEQAINPEAVYSLISIMTDDESRQYIFGKKNPLNLPGRVVAAKTGTTQNWKDGWTVGFTPQIAAGVWTGNNDSSLMRSGADGVFTAAPIWQRFMEEAHKDLPAVDFPVPSGVVQIAYDANSNRPATAASRNTRMEPFPWYAVPKDLQISAAPRNVNRNILTPLDPPKELELISPPPAPVIPDSQEVFSDAPTTQATPSTDRGGVPDEEARDIKDGSSSKDSESSAFIRKIKR